MAGGAELEELEHELEDVAEARGDRSGDDARALTVGR